MPTSNSVAHPWRWVILMLVSLLAGSLWTIASRDPSAVEAPLSPLASPREGFLAPDFTLTALHGGDIKLSDLRGKVVVVNLWAT